MKGSLGLTPRVRPVEDLTELVQDAPESFGRLAWLAEMLTDIESARVAASRAPPVGWRKKEDDVADDSGVFVLRATADGWRSDPDVPGSQMQELVHADGLWAGSTRFTEVDGPVTWTPERREVAFILEGSVRIEVAGAAPVDLSVGDAFSLPPGVETTWHITTPFREMWVLASD